MAPGRVLRDGCGEAEAGALPSSKGSIRRLTGNAGSETPQDLAPLGYGPG